MGLFSRFESKAEDIVEGSGGRGGIEPVKLAKRACKEMEREKMVGVGHEYAPTLYNVLVSATDDASMNGYYPSLAGEIETYLTSSAQQRGLTFDCPPLVRFIVDDALKRGRFDIIAESVSPAIVEELRHEEMVRYGLEQDEPAAPPPSQASSYTGYHDSFDAAFEPSDSYSGYGALGDEAPTREQPAPEPAPAYVPEPTPEPTPVVPAAAAEQARAYPPTVAGGAERTVMLGATPAAQPRATLVNRATGEEFALGASRTVIGRESSCDVTIVDPSVSRRHAELLHSDSGWLVRDTGSTNGTSVNGSTTTQARLFDGDVLALGKTTLEFREG